ncbi:LysR family transcriptional regulator StgR [Amycolatopsis oliviviridis]|uniref:LysR family transcriptional regulator n=1 Tax=Amycolatopsis oliviviridis TaxID=1471590 RepID=A0ABQ3LGB8_9PSEU|nr:LysR family transcriptional regulator [Amycolatopsis oliviviridis]GHH07807.1 LysR family transcriptional regulator [Amycolatopsis oliviviridis]
MTDLDLRLVRYAVALAEELHFGRAANRLLIAQQTLSAQIGQLEQRLGVVLFIRDRRHVEVTDAGAVFVERGRRLLADAEDLVTALGRTALPLRIDVITEGLVTNAIAQVLRERLSGQPLEVLQGQGLAGALPDLAQGRLDMAFGRVNWPGMVLPKSIQHELVRLEPHGLVVPEGHPLEGRAELRMRELQAHPLLLHTSDRALDWHNWNVELAEEFGLTHAEKLHGHGRSAANAAILAYGLPAIAPLTAPVPDGVVVIPVVDPVPLYPFSLLWRPDRADGAITRAVQVVRDAATELGWLIPPWESWWLPSTDREYVETVLRGRH